MAVLLFAGACVPLSVPPIAVQPTPPVSAVDARVEALLVQMTLDEKIGQMLQLTISAVASRDQMAGRIVLDSARLEYAIGDRHVGSLLNVLDAALPVEGWHDLLTRIQTVASTRTRLGIPVLYGVDFVHGANYLHNGTIFPHNVALAATFDTGLARIAGEVTAQEAVASGLQWNFSPVLDIGRQPLWPRFYETFGEDPLVAAQMGSANVAGMQGSGRVAGTAKHYLGYSLPRSGRDRTPAPLTEREVREYVLPPFREAVRAGVRTVMLNSGDIDGEPIHASRYWVTDVLRTELGFDGVVVSDWGDIDNLHTHHRVAATRKDAVRLAVEAGIDMSMAPYGFEFADELKELVTSGVIPERRIDESVRRILRLKAELGLFHSPYPDPTLRGAVGSATSRALARRVVRTSVTLLKNDGVLPLRRGLRLLVSGPAANSLTALHGGWTYTWQGAEAARYPPGSPTLLDAIRTRSDDVAYVQGAGFTAASDSSIAAAALAATRADVAVVVLGEEPYAEWVGNIDDLTLPDAQLRLARAVQATGTPTVIVLLEGRPRVIAPIVSDARGIVLAYWPGMEGAEGTAEVLFGEVNPSGRLPFTYPKAPNALIPYDHRYTETLNAEMGRGPGGFDPQFEFGHGLSYTSFSYADLALERAAVAPGQQFTAEVTVTNTGDRPGEETVLLFTRQHYARLAPPVRRLRGFQRVALAPGESRRITIVVDADQLSYIGRDGRPVLEPGVYDVMIGELKTSLRVER